jgi:hypothetical protein
MAGGINQECAMLKHDNSRNATNEKTSQRAESAIPEKTSQRWQTKADQHCEQMNMSMCHITSGSFFRSATSSKGGCGKSLSNSQPIWRVEKTFADVVRIFVVIDVFMMAAVLACPHQHRILERTGAENESKQTHRPFRPESHV